MSKILIVDDTAFMRLNIRTLLSKSGLDASFFEAENGIQAIEQFQAINPDLIIMDITMPDMDGITALKEIKKINKDAKVLMCSAMGQQQRVVEAIQEGASSFIVKPFDNDRFVETVKKLL